MLLSKNIVGEEKRSNLSRDMYDGYEEAGYQNGDSQSK
tara:strand:- start:543 stop:656 length:114 start_codon:yes stop_codon:yes gene_type:complete